MATPISLGMALNVLTGGALIASLPRMRGRRLVAIAVVASLALVGGGVAAMAVSGELRELREALLERGEPGGEQPVPGPTASPGGESPGGEAPGGEVTTRVVAKNVAFDLDELRFTAGEPTALTFVNEDPVPHNVAIYVTAGGDALFQGEIFAGPDERAYDIPAMDAGSYVFQCDVHPNMNGTVTVA
jgi:plastocyanin